jgi:hypothetical protein
MLIAALLASMPWATHAAPPAVIEGLQMPAWLERDGVRTPLKAGTVLSSRDRLHTGQGARVLLRLEEGSYVKLGENAAFNLAALNPPTQAQSVFEGALEVLKGAFRFTTAIAGRSRTRNIKARVATLTIGIRGTDVWGKAEADRDLVVLIDGQVEVTHDDGTSVALNEPRQTVVAPKGQSMQPVIRIDEMQLEKAMQETDLHMSEGVVFSEGRWVVQLGAFKNPDNAQRLRSRLFEAGYAVEEEQVQGKKVPLTHIVIRGFIDKVDAQAFAGRIQTQFELVQPWIFLAPR